MKKKLWPHSKLLLCPPFAFITLVEWKFYLLFPNSCNHYYYIIFSVDLWSYHLLTIFKFCTIYWRALKTILNKQKRRHFIELSSFEPEPRKDPLDKNQVTIRFIKYIRIIRSFIAVNLTDSIFYMNWKSELILFYPI